MPKKTAAKKAPKTATKKSGGARSKAGRPKGSGKYGCETKVVRIPSHLADEVHSFILKKIKSAK